MGEMTTVQTRATTEVAMRMTMMLLILGLGVGTGCVSGQEYTAKEREATECDAQLKAERHFRNEQRRRNKREVAHLEEERAELVRSLEDSEVSVAQMEAEMAVLVHELTTPSEDRTDLAARSASSEERRRWLEERTRSL